MIIPKSFSLLLLISTSAVALIGCGFTQDMLQPTFCLAAAYVLNRFDVHKKNKTRGARPSFWASDQESGEAGDPGMVLVGEPGKGLSCWQLGRPLKRH